jgi:predicted nucleotidyltransferase
MKFSKVLPILFKEFKVRGVDFALIGGVAIHSYGIDRSTVDVDFLILSSSADEVEQIMRSHSYEVGHKTATFVNYVSKDPDMGRVDFMFAGKEHSKAILDRAEENWVIGHAVKVARVEDIIGLKVLSSSNDPNRASKDLWDIEDLMRRYRRTLDWELVRDYFRLFDRETEYKNLRKKTS